MSALEQQPDNKNFLSPLGFAFRMQRAPHLNYFCQSATLPTVTLTETQQANPMAELFLPGEHIIFEPFNLRFRIDEDMKNYMEIFDWMVALGAPVEQQQYAELAAQDIPRGIKSDGTLMVLSSNMNPHIRISFVDLYPTALTPLTFDTQLADLEYLEAEVVFRYRNFTLTKL